MANIKKLFEQGQGNKLLTNSSVADVGDPIESADFVKSRVKQAKTFVPNVNFATASNFAFYGLAEEYYKNSFEYIRGLFNFKILKVKTALMNCFNECFFQLCSI